MPRTSAPTRQGPGRRCRFWVIGAFICPQLLGGIHAQAGLYDDPESGPKTMIAGDATVTFNSAAPGEITEWTVDGVNHLASQTFWYRIGDDGPEIPLTEDAQTVSDIFPSCDTCTNDARHSNLTALFEQPSPPDFLMWIYLRLSSDSTPEYSELLTSVSPGFFRNLTDEPRPPIEIHVFQLVYFDFFSAANNSIIEVTDNTTIVQTATEGPFASVTQNLTAMPASRIQVGGYQSLLALFKDDQPTTLSDFAGPFESNDAAWVLQWDITLDPENQPSTGPFVSVFTLNVPEPATLIYSILGIILLNGARPRR